MPQWEVTGCDRTTGRDVQTIVDAPTRDEAVRLAGANMLIERIVERKPLRVETIPYARPADPEQVKAGRWAGVGKWLADRAVLVVGAFIVILALMAVVWVFRGKESKPACGGGHAGDGRFKPIGRRLTMANMTPHFTHFQLKDDGKTLDGLPMRLGTNFQPGVIIRLDGEADNLRYAHVAVPLSREQRQYVCGESNGGRMSKAELEGAGENLSLLSHFLDNAAHGGSPGLPWIVEALRSTAPSEKSIVADGIQILIATSDGMVKISAAPIAGGER